MNRGRYRTPSPPISRTSTVLFDRTADLAAAIAGQANGDRSATTYGIHGTPTTLALEELLLAGEGGAGVSLTSSGLSAITLALLSVARHGSHLLVTDSAYGPTRRLCDWAADRLGVEVEYYDPLVGAGIAALLRPTTCAVWMESPGTYTFEVQDVPAIVAAAKAADRRAAGATAGGGGADRPVVTILDNTWGSPGLFRPFDHGVDISVVALTKYWGGHADLLMGAVVANDAMLPAVREAAEAIGTGPNGEDAWLVVRGARTAEMRIRACGASALELAVRLSGHPRVGRVLHPGLPDDPGHALWARDFHGSSGLFAFELLDAAGAPADREAADAVADRLAALGHFGLGYSWGGFESLVMPARWGGLKRSVRRWSGGQIIRLHAGLEPVDVLWADLDAALAEA